MKMLKKIVLTAITCIGLISVGFVSLKPEVIIGGLVYTQGTEELAKKSVMSGKPFVAYFTADWCVYCTFFKRDVLENPDVVKALSNVDRYVVDLTDRTDMRWDWVRRLGGVGIPFFIIYKDGQIITTRDPATIIRTLNG